MYAKKEAVSVVALSRINQLNNLVESVARGNGNRKKTFLSITLENQKSTYSSAFNSLTINFQHMFFI